jgi:ribonuclease P/MRP protein subunit RPP1
MFYDLNIPWNPTSQPHTVARTLHFAAELGYNVVALNHTISGKLPAQITCAIPTPITPASSSEILPPKLEVKRRVTLVLTDSHQNVRLADLAKAYDLLAVRPVDEKSLQQACSSLDCDIISLDLTQRFSFYFKHKMLSEAIKSGKRIELCYSQGLLGDSAARRNLIANATQLIRATRGRGLIISSESKSGAIGCRGPWDAINLATIWGLPQERGFEAMSKEAKNVVVTALLKRTSYRGVVDVVYGGEKPAELPKVEKAKEQQIAKGKQKPKENKQPAPVNGQKRKAEEIAKDAEDGEKPISKREAKRRAKAARLSNGQAVAGGVDTGAGNAEEGKDSGGVALPGTNR